MGKTDTGDAAPFCRTEDGRPEGAVCGAVFGTYLHGLFDSGELVERLAAYLAERKGISVPQTRVEPRAARRERQYDRLAEVVRESLDMERIYREMEAFCDETAAR